MDSVAAMNLYVERLTPKRCAVRVTEVQPLGTYQPFARVYGGIVDVDLKLVAERLLFAQACKSPLRVVDDGGMSVPEACRTVLRL